jgi:hypothetical protein
LNTELEKGNLYRLDTNRQGGKLGVMLTMVGWERYEALQKANLESRTAFMAIKFDDASVNQAVDECFRPAVRRAGFELKVLTDQQGAGSIDDQIRAGLLAARFVIADLTRGSHGAYWEAGYAEGRNIPVIYTCERDSVAFSARPLPAAAGVAVELRLPRDYPRSLCCLRRGTQSRPRRAVAAARKPEEPDRAISWRCELILRLQAEYPGPLNARGPLRWAAYAVQQIAAYPISSSATDRERCKRPFAGQYDFGAVYQIGAPHMDWSLMLALRLRGQCHK